MLLLIVESDPFKRGQIARHLSSKGNVEFAFAYSLKPALEFIEKYWWKLSGVILSLGLTTDKNTNDYDSLRGFDLIDSLYEENYPLPILINSDSQIYFDDMVEFYYSVQGQMNEYDAQILDSFLESLQDKFA